MFEFLIEKLVEVSRCITVAKFVFTLVNFANRYRKK